MMLFGMEQTGSQLELCSYRKIYERPQIIIMQKEQQGKSEVVIPKPCVFCDSKILATNHVLMEDKDHDVRVMMNKFPYFDFDQGSHLLVMPISHKEHPCDFSHKELAEQVKTLKELAMNLYGDAYMQEFCASWGAMGGQSQPHWHSHLKSYVQPSMSLPEQINFNKNRQIKTLEQAFKAIKIALESTENSSILFPVMTDNNFECNCCQVNNNHKSDEYNLVVERFKYNYICLSHHPRWPGELSIVPHQHASSLKDLSQETFKENMILAMALLPKMKEYAQAHIRECDGGNIFIKSIGNKVLDEEKNKYHVHTLVIPRTTVPITPGGMDGTSTKIDCDPLHLFQYLKNMGDELKKIIT